jgi:hypothetical protein
VTATYSGGQAWDGPTLVPPDPIAPVRPPPGGLAR